LVAFGFGDFAGIPLRVLLLSFTIEAFEELEDRRIKNASTCGRTKFSSYLQGKITELNLDISLVTLVSEFLD
jgi:hypothetical protein